MITAKIKVNGDKAGYINIRQEQPDIYRCLVSYRGISKEFDIDIPANRKIKDSELLELALKYYNNETALIEALLNG